MIKYFELVLILLLTTILVICIPFSQSWQTSHCDCDPVTNNELCDPICEGTCAAPRLCPPWLQGQWKSAKNWELTVVGDHVSAVILTQPFSGTMRCGLNLSKATTALNFYGVKGEIDLIIEDNKLKHNKLVPGVNIPIVDKGKIKNNNKNTIVVLAWNYFDEIKKNNKSISTEFINIKDLEITS